MDIYDSFHDTDTAQPFTDYADYMDCLFACVGSSLDWRIEDIRQKYATPQGEYKNIFFPDLEVARSVCREKLYQFAHNGLHSVRNTLPINDILSYINVRAAKTVESGIPLPFYELCKRLEFQNFTIFCFACGIIASTQTDYAAVFQIVNENGNLPVPTIESAAKLYFGTSFSITKAYKDMSLCLEQLTPILDLTLQSNMPFSTEVTLDKRMIDFLFGSQPMKPDENYIRFFSMMPEDETSTPIMANRDRLEMMELSYQEGIPVFFLVGDEGSGRKFFIRRFCKKHDLKGITLNCRKLFTHDYDFVLKALWAVTRECILTHSCCCLDELSMKEDEKDNFLEYMDMALTRLTAGNILVFALSREKLPLRDIKDAAVLEFPIPTALERENCWNCFAKEYTLEDDVSLSEMAAKFLFTPGKIKAALSNAKGLASMHNENRISKSYLFSGCYSQTSSDLTQKATKMKTLFCLDDIVMGKEQKEIIEHAINQVNFRKKIYENWNYGQKYPYGRGMSILLFGAPGTGKSMCAQIIAHELNLELYRVDLSKVMDKYIGETEKSIFKIFNEARKCNAVLFFDECDALFAKRSDEGNAMQAFHNTKAAMLLQEIETYDGVSVLATNHKHSIDPAFFRRMKYVVEFQFPDADTREMLWRFTVPKETPLGDDVDFRFLAEKFEFSGGNIKNCVLNAAFLAASDGEGNMVHMKHYLKAIRYEYIKTGKVFTKADFHPYGEEVFGH